MQDKAVVLYHKVRSLVSVLQRKSNTVMYSVPLSYVELHSSGEQGSCKITPFIPKHPSSSHISSYAFC